LKVEQEIIIGPDRTFRGFWKDLWQFRDLFYFLSWRDVLVRYKQTVVGIAWAILRPLLMMIVFTLIFSKLARFPSDGNAPYPILVFAGMLPWLFFSSALTECSGSLVGHAPMITKIYFPRIIVPASSILVSLVDFLISLIILFFFMVLYGFYPDWHVLFLPFFLLLSIFFSFGLGLWFAVLNVKFRDFRYVVPFLVQVGLYVSPVGFSSSVVPGKWRLLYSLNPMAGVIDGFRWALLGGESSLYLPGLILSLVVIAILCGTAFRYFRKAEREFADVI
jgi:lipopolysaccharide transport system permease protein